MILRVVMVERALCVPHRKHDIEDEMEPVTLLNGEPPALDW